MWSSARDIRRHPISYVIEDGAVANNKIIRLGGSVPSRMFSSRIRFFRCHRARVSLDSPIFLDDAGPGIAWEQIFDVIFLPALCPFVQPLVKDLLLGPSLHTANFLFSLPHFLPSGPCLVSTILAECLLSRCRYLLLFFHITFWSIFTIAIFLLHWAKFLVKNGQTSIFGSYQSKFWLS